MAVTITLQPGIIELSRGEFRIKATTDEYATTVGANCVLALIDLNLAGAGDNISITWPLATAGPSFVFSNTPTSGQIKTISVGQNIADWIDKEVLPVFRSSVRLTDFEIDRNANSVIMAAKSIGAGYELDVSFTGFAGVKTFAQHGSDAEVRSDMRLRMRVQTIDIEGNSDASPWVMYDVVPYQPNETTLVGQVEADLTKVIDAMLSDQFPENGFNTPAEWSNTRAFVEVAEHYDNGSDPWLISSIRTELRVVAKGESAIRDKSTSFYNRIFLGKRFMTNRVSGIKVWGNIEDWLFYFHDQSNTEDRHVKAKVYYTDSSEAFSTLLTYTDLHLKCYIIPCGFEQAGLDALNPGLIPYKYEIWVERHDGTILVNKFIFWLLDEDDTCGGIHYINAFGCAETLPIEGDHTFLVKPSRTLADVSAKNYNRETLTERSFDRSFTPEIVVESVPLTAEQLSGYMDILLSRDVLYELPGNYLRVAAQMDPEDVRVVPETRTGNQLSRIQVKLKFNQDTGNSNWSRFIN